MGDQRWACALVLLWVTIPLLLGGCIGFAVPSGPGWERVSAVLGWCYFCAWSVSFYPQVFANCQSRSVRGLSLDYQMLNLAGFACYGIFNAALFFDPCVQLEYSKSHGGSTSAVQANDVVFACHAALITF